jgi:hypothetical protein
MADHVALMALHRAVTLAIYTPRWRNIASVGYRLPAAVGFRPCAGAHSGYLDGTPVGAPVTAGERAVVALMAPHGAVPAGDLYAALEKHRQRRVQIASDPWRPCD